MEIQKVIEELKIIHVFLLARSEDTTRVALLASTLSDEVNRLLDKKLLQSHNKARVQELRSLASSLDELKQDAAYSFNTKLRDLNNGLAEETISGAAKLLESSMANPDALLRDTQAFVNHLLKGEMWLVEVDAIRPQFQEVVGSFKEKFFSLLSTTVRSSPAQLGDLRSIAQKMDDLAAKVLQGQRWEPMAVQAKLIIEQHSNNVLPDLVAAAERELDRGEEMKYDVVLARLNEVGPWWVKPGKVLEERMAKIIERFDFSLMNEWDACAQKGGSEELQDLLRIGRQYDKSSAVLTGRAANQKCELLKKMEEYQRQVTATELIKRIRTSIESKQEELQKQQQEAKQKLQQLSREQLEETDPPTWMFKLRKGGFKAYTKDKSAEVEQAYQAWIANGKPSKQTERRIKLAIDIPPPTPGSKDRADNPLTALQEMYSIDFMLLTQMNMTKGTGMRKLKRAEPSSAAQKLTGTYFASVSQLFKSVVGDLEEVEADMRLMGARAAGMQKSIDEVLQSLTSCANDFLEVAVLVRDMKSINDFISLLRNYTEKMGIDSKLKELRLRDVTAELARCHAPIQERSIPAGWEGLKQLHRKDLLHKRLKLHETKIDLQIKSRRRAMMLSQALLSEYSSDRSFCAKFRAEAAKILGESARRALQTNQADELCAVLRGLKSFECDVADLVQEAREWVRKSISDACADELTSSKLIAQLLDDDRNIAKAAQTSFEDFSPVKELVPAIVGRALKECTLQGKQCALLREKLASGAKASKEKIAVGEIFELQKMIASSVLQIATVRSKLWDTTTEFDSQFWAQLHPKYEQLGMDEKEATIEWTVAFCEQVGVDIPDWMMNKDQVEAMKKLQVGVQGNDLDLLVEAMIFAKRTKATDPQFVDLSKQAMEKLRNLKKLPPGWEVNQMVGDDPRAKIFGEVDLNEPSIKAKFQSLLDATNVGILTRDRVALQGTTDLPRGYRVERVVSVMNADSWELYLNTRDKVASECAKFATEVPTPSGTWEQWSGPVATAEHGQAILSECKLPPLEEGANEFLMLHGTKPDAAQNIAHNHFDMAFACKDGLFGAGLYFAESSSKSDEYVKCDDKSHYPLIVARVTLGHVNYCDAKDPTVDPGRDKLLDSCLAGEFHSVLGDRKKVRNTYREFIVYDHYQVYPQFIGGTQDYDACLPESSEHDAVAQQML
eukprot:CAMPEP_0178391804 /NCGR_PEP_ID=MMETSP0689_2-20121128/11352_1 /TAXON_ID=160604 /ORGANISM="Amphidinium massartii, Strain CS-259" /LENGTH=1180 /DNA_ID=CAMNT_0020012359 /DNA_START=96 /DNA_END=3639 /DNA_ORIENTATION=+